MLPKIGSFVLWDGIADRIIGTVVRLQGFGKWEIRKLNGSVCDVDQLRLREATLDEVDWAIHLGGCTIPLTGNPPTCILGK